MKLDLPDILKEHYLWVKQHSAKETSPGIALEIISVDRVGLIADISTYVTSMGGSLLYIQSWSEHTGHVRTLIQVNIETPEETFIGGVLEITNVEQVIARPTYLKTYGKRVIVVGGGAQVAQVASGAIAEADRHNIRGETISVDTMAVVGEEEIARAVQAVGRLHRASILVLAGSLMGGKITEAVYDLRHNYGIPVIALSMAGSVTRVSDLVITDPTEAGVMAVMLISHIGQFNLLKIHGSRF